ncbi:6037_t:CDS:10 [Paraglomus brasilianum]|uniref:6037_t:CDS:1 n=1 Tax=Paraglomus brasilianum TaxID=144538 RepID=A0A9N9FXG6_9GLOM|nr:6037_t:CDS:10 [Paraglomus brasilianum]
MSGLVWLSSNDVALWLKIFKIEENCDAIKIYTKDIQFLLVRSSVSELEYLLDHLMSEEQHDLATSLPSLISGLESCRQLLGEALVDGNTRAHVWDQVRKAGQLCAELAKNEKARDPIGSSGAIELLVTFLTLNTTTEFPLVDHHCLRAIANLCIDHEQNRKRMLDVGGVKAALQILTKYEDLMLLRTVCGTLLNAGLDYDPVNIEISKVGGVMPLARMLSPDNFLRKAGDTDLATSAVHFAARVVLNVVGTEEGKKELANVEAISALVQLLNYTSSPTATENDADILDNIVEILEIMALENDETQQIIVQNGLFTPLLDYLEFAEPPKAADKRIDKLYGEWKAAILKVIVSATMNDGNMDILFNDTAILQRYFSWLTRGPDRDDLQACAALSLGNLARSDDHCIRLVQESRVIELLIDALRNSANIKVQHATVSLLKNLSLPGKSTNKSIIGFLGVIEVVSQILTKDTIQPVQFGVVGILKHLSSLNIQNSRRIVMGDDPADNSGTTPLERLMTLIEHTDDMPIRSEGTRILVNLIKNLWSKDLASQLDTNYINDLRKKLNTAEVVKHIETMIIDSKYPVLQNEGVIGLTMLVMDDSATAGDNANPALDALTTDSPRKQTESHLMAEESAGESSSAPSDSQSSTPSTSLLDTLVAVVVNNSDKYPDEIRGNVCILLEKTANAAYGSRKQYLRDRILAAFKSLLEPNGARPISEPVKGNVEKVLLCLDQ